MQNETREDPSQAAGEQGKPMRAGEVCPFCGQGVVDYDGMLALTCPVCGRQEGGCFT